MKRILLVLILLVSFINYGQDLKHGVQNDVVYGHKDGLALTMVVVTPTKSNGKAIIALNSGGWVSNFSRNDEYLHRAMPFVDAGYTIFLVMHGSAPRYAIPDAFADVQRAVQFVRYNAGKYHIDKDNIGITGTSSGGHLSLLAGTSDDIMNVKSKDSVEQVSSKVQAVAVFSPPTDFISFGAMGYNPTSQLELLRRMNLLGAFQYTFWDTATNTYKIVTNTEDRAKIDNLMSPAELATSDDAPTFLIHGDSDVTVPLQQSQLMEQRLKAANVAVKLVVKNGAGHGWKNMEEDENEFVNWFDIYLKVKK